MLFVVPCALVVLLMMIVPVVRTVSFAFSKVTLPSFDTEFTGLENFRKILAMEEFPAVIRNTFIWVAGSVILRVSLGFLAAMVMDGQGKGIKMARLLALLPWTVPSIVSANSWRWILQGDFGVLNMVLREMGLGSLAKLWLGTAAPVSAIFCCGAQPASAEAPATPRAAIPPNLNRSRRDTFIAFPMMDSLPS